MIEGPSGLLKAHPDWHRPVYESSKRQLRWHNGSVAQVFSAEEPDVLFSHVGNDQRVKLNKNAAVDTASLVFQDNFSGRAEMGLAGDDDFHVKVSADGFTWNEALTINRATGQVTLPQGLANNTVSNAQLADMATGAG